MIGWQTLWSDLVPLFMGKTTNKYHSCYVLFILCMWFSSWTQKSSCEVFSSQMPHASGNAWVFFFWEWILPLKHTNTIAANKVFSVFSVFHICRSFLLLVNWQGFSLAGGLWQKRTALVLLQHFFIASCSDSCKTFTEKKNNSQLKNGFTSPPLYNVHAANQVSDVLFVFIILRRGTEPVRQVPDKRQHPPSYCPVLQCTEASGSVLKWTPLFLTVFLEGFLFFK